MAVLAAHPSPTSFQLRWALNCRKPSPASLRIRFPAPDARRRLALLVAAGSPPGGEFVGPASRESSAGSSDPFSGWSGEEAEGGAPQKGRFGGIMGAGLAGIFLAAGITFAALSLGQKNAGTKRQMEPMKMEQEALLVSDEQNVKIDPVENESSSTLSEEGPTYGLDSNTAPQVSPGRILVPAVVDQVQGQALAALQVLKVIEADIQPGDICSRREYARWLVSASSILSRSTTSKVYPAMYIENVTELAFDDVTPEDPDFPFIQGLAEAGLISSKLSKSDMNVPVGVEEDPVFFYPESPVSRQDLVSWKMALEKRQLPEVDRKILYQCSGYIDIDKINPEAWPALTVDLSTREHGIIPLAFGYTRLFQPDKPVTKAQAAIALATGDADEVVGEELARIEAESMADAAVVAHTALVAQVEKDLNARFEQELTMERQKIDAVEKLAEEARSELEKLKREREEENNALIRGHAAVESEMEILSKLRNEVEEQLQSLMSNKVEIAFERERINKLRKEAEKENEVIVHLQYELEVERKALSMARAWAEKEAKRASEQAKALEEARERWERDGLKVNVDQDLRDEELGGTTWLNAGKRSLIEETIDRGENLLGKLKSMSISIKGKSAAVIEKIIQIIMSVVLALKRQASEAFQHASELRMAIIAKASTSIDEFRENASEFGLSIADKSSKSTQELLENATLLCSTMRDGAKRAVEDCREGMEKITQRFKTT
uniref:Huntingtin-interacting protein 1 n=1 Tax=Anthurium amnicola TaxID=1678845 RepID=A0A1D1ZIE1_9ARAE